MITVPLDYNGKHYLIDFTAERKTQNNKIEYQIIVYEPTHKFILPKADHESLIDISPHNDSLEIGLKNEIAKLIQNTFGYPNFDDEVK